MKKHLQIAALLFVTLTATGCDASPAVATEVEITGWKNLRFGMSLEESMSLLPNVRWNILSWQNCLKRTAVEGCMLHSDDDRSVMPLEDGIMLLPSLRFDKSGKLTEVIASYHVRDQIKPKQCSDVFERLLDSTTTKHGKLTAPKNRIYKDGDLQTRHSPMKNEYLIKEDKNGFYGTEPLRSSYLNENGAPVAFVEIWSIMLNVDGRSECIVNTAYRKNS